MHNSAKKDNDNQVINEKSAIALENFLNSIGKTNLDFLDMVYSNIF